MFKFIPREVPENLRFDIKSIKEEIANMISHGVGLVLFLIASPFLIYFAYQSGNNWYFWGSIIYAISLLMVYTSSTLYHSAYLDKLRRRLRTFDHICIYFLIAGSYTPFILTHFKDSTGWTIFIILWCMVLMGTIFKIFYTHKFKVVSTVVYLVMGWLAIFLINPMIAALPKLSLIFLIVCGAFYTLGAIFYLWKSLYQNHFIWHLFVLAGSISHFLSVLFCLES